MSSSPPFSPLFRGDSWRPGRSAGWRGKVPAVGRLMYCPEPRARALQRWRGRSEVQSPLARLAGCTALRPLCSSPRSIVSARDPSPEAARPITFPAPFGGFSRSLSFPLHPTPPHPKAALRRPTSDAQHSPDSPPPQPLPPLSLPPPPPRRPLPSSAARVLGRRLRADTRTSRTPARQGPDSTFQSEGTPRLRLGRAPRRGGKWGRRPESTGL